MANFEGRTALVTGAAGMIGSAIAAALLADGARVVAADMRGTDWRRFDDATAGTARIQKLSADVTDEASVRALVRDAKAATGRIDLFVSNAAIVGAVEPITEVELADFQTLIGINVTGAFLGLKHVIPAMARVGGGAIVTLSSAAELPGAAGLAPYYASQHAIVGLTRSAALEWADKGIRINAVSPGPIDSGRPRIAEAQAEEIAALIAHLLSDAAGGCNGGVYTVGGERRA